MLGIIVVLEVDLYPPLILMQYMGVLSILILITFADVYQFIITLISDINVN